MKQVINKRRNFLPTLILVILFWAGWGYILFKIPPVSYLSLFAFFVSLFLALFLSTALIFANSRRGFLLAIFTILFLLFRYYQIANVLNLILLVGVLLTTELYYSR